jgi:hypothetical protein
MIAAHRAQRSFADGLIAEEVSDLWEDWMRAADQVLDDEQLLSMVYGALSKRRPQSRTRGRLGTPAEVVLRLLLLKHIATGVMKWWSARYAPTWLSVLHSGGRRQGPDDTVINKWALALGPKVIENLYQRVVAIAREQKVVEGRKMRVDAERRREQKKPWFRNGREGRISVVKRRHGLNRCRDKGDRGMQRWIGLGIIGDNLINIGRVLTRRVKTTPPTDEH